MQALVHMYIDFDVHNSKSLATASEKYHMCSMLHGELLFGFPSPINLIICLQWLIEITMCSRSRTRECQMSYLDKDVLLVTYIPCTYYSCDQISGVDHHLPLNCAALLAVRFEWLLLLNISCSQYMNIWSHKWYGTCRIVVYEERQWIIGHIPRNFEALRHYHHC